MRIFWIFLFVFLPLGSPRADWPEWRGNRQHDGTWSHALPSTLPANPKVWWKKSIGGGYSGPAVVGDRLYILDRLVPTETREEQERVLCLDAQTGRTVWTHEYPSQLKLRGGYENGPRSTPLVDGNKVFTLGAMGHLHCLETQTGRVIWKKDFVQDYGAQIPDWGTVNPPWVENEKLIVQVGGTSNATVVAFHKETGKELWRNLTNKAGYSPIVGIDSGSGRQLVVWTADAIHALDPKDGKSVWSVSRKLAWDQAIATPLYHAKEKILLFSSDREGSLALRLNRHGLPEVAWENFSFSSLQATPVLDGDYFYGINHNGNVRQECGEFRCLKVSTGELMWKTPAVTRTGIWAHASVTKNKSNGLFYILNEQGELILARATPKGFEEKSRVQLLGKTWSHPAFVRDRVYARSENTLICASLTKEDE